MGSEGGEAPFSFVGADAASLHRPLPLCGPRSSHLENGKIPRNDPRICLHRVPTPFLLSIALKSPLLEAWEDKNTLMLIHQDGDALVTIASEEGG